ncbi:MAG: phytoene desaturase family protein [Planctomycetota bacterium]|jgi:phytoene dehydrogenase-like protein
MHFDVVIIGAGMSGLAAGIRAAYFDKRVCILERHYAYGGLNSYYTFARRPFDVGLHALTNFAPPNRRHAPMNKLLRQLRLDRDELDLCQQHHSEIRFPGRRLRFDNQPEMLVEDVRREFPQDIDGFLRLCQVVDDYDDTRLDAAYASARKVLAEFVSDPVLVDMLLCPLMYYGSAEPRDMDFTQFVTMFKALFREGFSRPRGGVRTIIKALVRRYRALGGKLRMRCGVKSMSIERDRVTAIRLDDGEEITADVVLSCAGYPETLALCTDGAGNKGADGQPRAEADDIGILSFVENIAVLDVLPAELGLDATIVFFNDSDRFTYDRPDDPIDLRSGVVCCPSNYERHEDMAEGLFRVTWLANADYWSGLDEGAYRAAKRDYLEAFHQCGRAYMPAFSNHVLLTDTFTPRTIQHFTGHWNGAVYGSPRKRRDGKTPVENLFICGTDQGFLGIIGAMLSGITIANLYVLQQ